MDFLPQIHIRYSDNNTYRILQHSVLSLFFGMLLLGSFPQQAYSASKIVKWKDDKGVTQYGDSIPAQYANGDSSEINQQGITVKHNKPANVQDQAADAAKLAQDKKDKVLLRVYTNADEIDLARDRNLQPDIVAVEGLEQQKKNNLKKLADNQNYAKKLSKKNKPVPSDLSADIKNNQVEIAKNEQQINERKVAMENTRKRFEQDKIRFQALSDAGAAPKEPPVTAKLKAFSSESH